MPPIRTTSAKVGSIPKYTQVKSTYKTSKGWYQVTYGGVTGYVSGDYLITKANYDKMNSYENNKNSYIHMDLRTKSSVTAAQINAYIAEHATSANSVLFNKGSAFITAANKYGVNALYLAAHAIHESNYGKSTIALAKNNLFGFGSYDSTPFVGSVKFASIEENIAFIAQEMKATFLNPSNWKYKGATLGYTIKDANGNRITDLSKGMNFYYASDSDWGKRLPPICRIYWLIARKELSVNVQIRPCQPNQAIQAGKMYSRQVRLLLPIHLLV